MKVEISWEKTKKKTLQSNSSKANNYDIINSTFSNL